VMLARLWKALGLTGIELQLNSIGDAGERAQHREKLIAYFEGRADALGADAKRRLHANPLRILDSRNPAMQPIIEEAPRLLDFIGGESRAHFESLQAMLGDAGLAYVVNPRLVRGLDYYNRTVFEWVSTSGELGAQGTVAGGGRYDYLFEMLGGKKNYACGFAIGIERMIALLAAAGIVAQSAPTAYVVHDGVDAAALARNVAERVRDAGMSIVVNAGGGSMKSQMKRADASAARYAIIIGQDEASTDTVAVKPLREGGDQISVPALELAERLTRMTRG